jgi:histone H3/H4
LFYEANSIARSHKRKFVAGADLKAAKSKFVKSVRAQIIEKDDDESESDQ